MIPMVLINFSTCLRATLCPYVLVVHSIPFQFLIPPINQETQLISIRRTASLFIIKQPMVPKLISKVSK